MSMHPTDSRIGATVLAALRFYQASRRWYSPTLNFPEDIQNIANCSGEVEPLTADEIDALCENLNSGGALWLPDPVGMPAALTHADMALILGGVGRYGGDGPMGNLIGHRAACDALLERLAPFEHGAVLTEPGRRLAKLTPATDANGGAELFGAEGCEPWTVADQRDAQAEGWELSQYSDGKICIVADEDAETPRWTGLRANIEAHEHVEKVAALDLYGGEYRPAYVQLCREALAIVAATWTVPVFAVELLAEGFSITAEDEDEARRYARRDAREFMAESTYRVASVEKSEDEPMEPHEILFEVTNLVEPGDQLPQPGPVSRDWCVDVRASVVVEAADRPAAVVEALRLLGVEEPECKGALAWVAFPEQAEARARILGEAE